MSFYPDIGPSPRVADGRVIMLGSEPGEFDAHVRPGYLLLRCERGDFEFNLNDDDAMMLMRIAATAARYPLVVAEEDDEP